MASLPEDTSTRPKKRKLSNKEKKKMMSEKGKKSASSRGMGVLSRQEFDLPAKWESDARQGETREIVDYYSPGKTKYRTKSDVEKVLRQRGMELCFDESVSPTEQPPSSESDGYDPVEELDHNGSASLPSTSKTMSTKSTKECQQLEVE